MVGGYVPALEHWAALRAAGWGYLIGAIGVAAAVISLLA